MTPDQLQEICQRGLELAESLGADQAEIIAIANRGSSIAFEKNDLQIAISDENLDVGVRVIKDRSLGFATSNSPATLEETVHDALALAKTSLPDEFNSLPGPKTPTPVEGLFDDSLEKMTVADITSIGAKLLKQVRDSDSRVSIDSGSVAATVQTRVIRSSTGVQVSESTTGVGGDLFGMAVDGDEVGSFVIEAHAQRAREGLEERLAGVADGFVSKAIGALSPGKGVSYRGVVLLTPEVVESLIIGNLLPMMSASSIRKKKSPLVDKIGETIASSDFSLYDNPLEEGAWGASAFDREGTPKQKTFLLEQGVFRDALFTHYEAVAAGRESGSTGHASGGATALPIISIANPAITPGSKSLDSLLNETDRCVLVTRFSGSTNPITGEFSGVVKAGFLVERGEKRPITETLISGNLLDLIRNVSAISQETKRVYGRSRLPWMLVDGISVTAG